MQSDPGLLLESCPLIDVDEKIPSLAESPSLTSCTDSEPESKSDSMDWEQLAEQQLAVELQAFVAEASASSKELASSPTPLVFWGEHTLELCYDRVVSWQESSFHSNRCVIL